MKTNEKKRAVVKHPHYQAFIRAVFFGYIPLIAVYLLRGQMYAMDNDLVTLLAGVMPNLAGSFMFTLLVMLTIANRRNSIAWLSNRTLIWRANAANLAMFLLIEMGHIWLNLGVWDNADMIASVLGIGLASLFVIWAARAYKDLAPVKVPREAKAKKSKAN
jgi:hypothetical protein